VMEATVLRVAAHIPKCPRCYRYEQASTLNFDGLCDRCCNVILKHHPDHDSAAAIKAAYAKQRVMTARDWRIHNHAIDPIAWPLQSGDNAATPSIIAAWQAMIDTALGE
jgi:hypothetical protein